MQWWSWRYDDYTMMIMTMWCGQMMRHKFLWWSRQVHPLHLLACSCKLSLHHHCHNWHNFHHHCHNWHDFHHHSHNWYNFHHHCHNCDIVIMFIVIILTIVTIIIIIPENVTNIYWLCKCLQTCSRNFSFCLLSCSAVVVMRRIVGGS